MVLKTRKILTCALIMLCVCLIAAVGAVSVADDGASARTSTAQIYWGITDASSPQLVLSPNESDTTGDGFSNCGYFSSGFSSVNSVPWKSYRMDIKSVEIKSGIAPTSTAYWFYEFTGITSIDLSSLNIGNITDMGNMFFNCEELTSVEFPSGTTATITALNCMFQNCYKLTYLDLSSFQTMTNPDVRWMFSGCDELTLLKLSDDLAYKLATTEYTMVDLYKGNHSTWYALGGDTTYTSSNKFNKGGTYATSQANCTTVFVEDGVKNTSLEQDIESAWATATAAGNATVTMYADAEIRSALNVGRNKNITLDLNGAQLKYIDGGTDEIPLIQVDGGKFTLIDGNPDKVNAITSAVSNAEGNYPEISVNGGVITGAKDSAVSVISGDFTMKGGNIVGNSAANDGGGVYFSGNNFTMSGGNISNNVAKYNGGGLYGERNVHIKGGKISGNGANNGGGVYFSGINFMMSGNAAIQNNVATSYGGGIYGEGNVYIQGGTISGNAADSGGGAYVSEDTFEMREGEISDNVAKHNGGGVQICVGATFKMGSSTTIAVIQSNRANNQGGGVYVATARYSTGGGTLEVAGGNILNNEAINGGGVYVDEKGILKINGTISIAIGYNRATNNDANVGGGVYFAGDTFEISGNVAINSNTKGESKNVSNVLLRSGKISVTGELKSGAVNSQIGVTCYVDDTSVFTQGYSENISGVKPSAYFTSDKDEYVCILRNGEAAFARPVATVTTADGVPVSYADIAEAFEAANNAGTAKIQLIEIIGISVKTGETLTVERGKTVTLDLNGRILRYNGTADSAVLSVSGTLTITDSNPQAANTVTSAVLDADGEYSEINVKGGVITGGKDSGVRVDGGTFIMDCGTIAGNTAYKGGGVYVESGAFTMSSGAISHNSANYGGGVYVANGTFTMSSGTISHNSAKDGGGVYVERGVFTMNNGTISDNSATNNGGGVYDGGGNFEMTKGEISNNTANSGGGVYVDNLGDFTVIGAVNITGNKKGEGDNAAPNNVYLPSGQKIYVGTLADGQGNKARIGVTLADDTGMFTSGYGVYNSGVKTSEYFVSDAGLCVQGKDNGYGSIEAFIENHSYGIDDGICSECNKTAACAITVDGATTFFEDFATAWEAATNDAYENKAVTLKLFADAETTDRLDANYNLTLDLNGRVIKYTGNSYFIYVGVRSANFTLTDSNPDAENTVTGAAGNEVSVKGGVITGGKNSAVCVSYGTFIMEKGTIAGNKGGGVLIHGGAFIMRGGEISHNISTNSGGGVAITMGTFTMMDGTISGNSSDGDGGGVYVDSSSSTFTMVSGTISGNSAQSGGGVHVAGTFAVFGAVNITGNKNSVGETATANNVYLSSGKKITVTGALTDGQNKAQIGVTLSNGSGAFTDGYGDNNSGVKPSEYFVSDAGLCVHDKEVDGHIEAFIENHDYDINNGICSGCGKTAACAITVESVTTFFEDFATAWEAAANVAYRDKAVTLKMFADAETTDTLTVEIGYNLTLDLNGRVLRYIGTASSAVITVKGTLNLTDSSPLSENTVTSAVTDETVNVAGGVITGGTDGGVYVSGTFTMEKGTIAGNSATNGGGVYVATGTFTMKKGTIAGNSASDRCGGVYVATGTFEMTDGEISNNSAFFIGGVYIAGGVFNMNGGDISGNSGNNGAGGVQVFGDFNMNGGAISNNSANNGVGGGVYVASGLFEMEDGAISNNRASEGGGIYVAGGTFLLKGGEISNNVATNSGGGVHVENGDFEMEDGEISNNSTNGGNGGGLCFGGNRFTMNGGTISNNSAGGGNGGGIYFIGSEFKMTNGTISNNVAASGGGVYIHGTFTISGAINITGNKNGVGETAAPNNVYLTNLYSKVTVSGALKDGQNKAQIGVTLYDGSGTFTNGYGVNNKDGDNHIKPYVYFVDDNGGCIRLDNGEAAVATEHDYEEKYTTDKAATCLIKGEESRHCKYCDSTTGKRDIAALGHTYGEPEWTWSADGRTASAKITCVRDGHAVSGAATVTSAVKTPATCTERGTTTYKAKVVLNGSEYASTKDIADIAAIGHSYGEVAYTWSGSICTAERVCAHNGSHKETETVSAAPVTTAPTCTEGGYDTLTAEFTNSAFATQTKQINGTEALGHSYGEWQTVTEATCSAQGSRKHLCTVCNHEEVEATAIDENAHSFGEWTVVKESTVEEFGEERRVCSHDNTHVETRQLPKRIAQLVEPDHNGGENQVVVTIPDGFTPDIELVVREISRDNYGSYEALAQSANGEIQFVYDVALRSNGATVQPDGALTIKLYIPENLRGKEFRLFHRQGDGEATEIEFTVDGNYAVVTADKLSEFIFVGEKADIAPAKKPFNPLWLILIIIVSLAIVGEVGFIVYREVRKKKAAEGK